MTEQAEGIQGESYVPGLVEIINNTSLMKHPISQGKKRRLACFEKSQVCQSLGEIMALSRG